MTEKKASKNNSEGKIIGTLKVSIIMLVIFSIGFIPLVLFIWLIILFIPFNQIWQYFLIPVFIYFGIVITIFYQLLFSGLIINALNIKYKPGLYEYTFKNKMTFKWILICSLYTPWRKILEIFPMGASKYTYLRLLGMKIGNNSLVGGVIKDPCLTEFGDNVTMGEYAIIYGHIQNFEKGTLFMNKVVIGDNCVIGAGAIIMPGAVLEKGAIVASGAVVTKGQVLKKEKMYFGIPAREYKSKKKNKDLVK